MFLALVSAAHAACSATQLEAQLGAAERALTNVDLAGLRAATASALESVACVDTPLSPALAARVHRATGLRAFFDKDPDAATAAFAAARAADAAITLPDAWLPSAHPVRKAWTSAEGAAPGVSELSVPAEGTLVFDGREVLERPVARPTVAQWRVDDEVRAGGYLWPQDPMFDYPLAGATERATARVEGGPNVPLLVASGALLVGAGVAYALAYDAHQRWADPATPTAEIDELRGLNNGLFVTSVVAGSLGAAGGVAAFAVGEF